jgi:hypothetical protein
MTQQESDERPDIKQLGLDEGVIGRFSKMESEYAQGQFAEVREGPIYLTEVVCSEAKGRLNMGGLSYDAADHPFQLGSNFTRGILSYLKDGGSPFVTTLLETIRKQDFDKYKDSEALKNNWSVGGGLVLLLFNAQFGPEFLERLRQIPQERLRDAFQPFQVPLSERNNIVGQVVNSPRIAAHQVWLQDFVDDYAEYTHNKVVFAEGAGAMYNVVEDLWPELSGNTPIKNTSVMLLPAARMNMVDSASGDVVS